MTDLDDAITRGWAEARRDDPEPTVIYFRDLLTRHPNAPAAPCETSSVFAKPSRHWRKRTSSSPGTTPSRCSWPWRSPAPDAAEKLSPA